MLAFARRFLHPFLFPPGAVFAAAVAVAATGAAATWSAPALEVLPYGFGGAAFLVGWRFSRSRVAFAALLVAGAWFALTRYPEESHAAETVAVLLPLLVATLTLGRERGVISLGGLVRFLAMGVPVALAVYAGVRHEATLLKVLRADWLPLPSSWTFGLSDTAAVISLVALVVLLVRSLGRRGAVESGLFWCVLASQWAVVAPAPHARAIMATATQITLLVALVESSHALAFRDELTGLPTRRALREALDRTVGRYALAMIDLDRFKRVNDRHGHDVGDHVLRMVAAQLGHVGGGGKVFRYGGEEFTVLFAGRDLEAAIPHLHKLRTDIADRPFVLRPSRRKGGPADRGRAVSKPRSSLRVTVSIGVAERSDRNPSADAVLKAADKALYKAKRKGRNRVCS